MKPQFFTTHALEALDQCLGTLNRGGPFYQTDYTTLKKLRERIQASVKFLLPEESIAGGILSRSKSDLTQEDMTNLRLPYPELVLEYSMPFIVPMPGKLASTRRVTYCREVNEDGINGIEVWSMAWLDKEREWDILPITVFLSYDAKVKRISPTELPEHIRGVVSSRLLGKDTTPSIEVSARVICPQIMLDIVGQEKQTQQVIRERMVVDLWEDLWAVFDFINLMSCANVEEDVLPPPHKLNKKRLESGKLPMFEYKVLTVKSGHSYREQANGGAVQDRNAPRQHIRRGHVRYYRSDDGSIRMIKHNGELVRGIVFIEQMVVGDPSLGRIIKDYKIKE